VSDGVMDIVGIIWEWTNDWGSIDYYSVFPVDNSPGYTSGFLRFTGVALGVTTNPSSLRRLAWAVIQKIDKNFSV